MAEEERAIGAGAEPDDAQPGRAEMRDHRLEPARGFLDGGGEPGHAALEIVVPVGSEVELRVGAAGLRDGGAELSGRRVMRADDVERAARPGDVAPERRGRRFGRGGREPLEIERQQPVGGYGADLAGDLVAAAVPEMAEDRCVRFGQAGEIGEEPAILRRRERPAIDRDALLGRCVPLRPAFGRGGRGLRCGSGLRCGHCRRGGGALLRPRLRRRRRGPEQRDAGDGGQFRRRHVEEGLDALDRLRFAGHGAAAPYTQLAQHGDDNRGDEQCDGSFGCPVHRDFSCAAAGTPTENEGFKRPTLPAAPPARRVPGISGRTSSRWPGAARGWADRSCVAVQGRAARSRSPQGCRAA